MSLSTVLMPVAMGVIMRKAQPVRLLVADLAPGHQSHVAATAYRAHQITSISLIRISSPCSGITLPLPQCGHGSRRESILAILPQS